MVWVLACVDGLQGAMVHGYLDALRQLRVALHPLSPCFVRSLRGVENNGADERAIDVFPFFGAEKGACEDPFAVFASVDTDKDVAELQVCRFVLARPCFQNRPVPGLEHRASDRTRSPFGLRIGLAIDVAVCENHRVATIAKRIDSAKRTRFDEID